MTGEPTLVFSGGNIQTSGPEPSRGSPKRSSKPRPRGWRRFFIYAGYALMSLGAALLLFVVYTLWGTRFESLAAQKKLEAQFKTRLNTLHASQRQELYDQLAAEWERASQSHGPIARIEIPKIGVDNTVVAGVDRLDLQRGPGALPATALPGGPGNSVISAHRVTYGAEFNRADELKPGEQIVITTIAGRTVYDVTNVFPIGEKDIEAAKEVTKVTQDDRITLTTCNPKYSRSERLIVQASMISGPFIDSVGLPRQAPQHEEPNAPPGTAIKTLPAG